MITRKIGFSEIFCCYRTPLNNIWGPIEIEDIFYFNNYLFYVLYEKGRDTFLKPKPSGSKLRMELNLLINKKLNQHVRN